MALRGAKPRPAQLRIVEGTHRPSRHGPAEEAGKAAEASAHAFGAIEMPASFRGHAATAWRRYVAPAFWLDASREPGAIAFCKLWAEFMKAPADFPSSKHAQLRAYMAELGLTDERNRNPSGDGKPAPPESPASKYF